MDDSKATAALANDKSQTAVRKVSRRNKLGFGVGGFGIALLYITLGQLLFYFYTEVYGFSALLAGNIIAFATLWDAIVDPVMAWVVSKTNTKFGRYRPYLIYGALPMSLLFISMFYRPTWLTGDIALIAFLTHILFRTAYTTIYMPYTAMVTRLSDDAHERSDLEAWRSWFLALGIFLVSFFGLGIVDHFGAGDDERGFLVLALIVASLSFVAILFTGLVTRELEIEAHDEDDESNFIHAISLLLQNRPFSYRNGWCILLRYCHQHVLQSVCGCISLSST